MNFNLDPTRIFKVLKGNFKAIFKYSAWLMTYCLMVVALFLGNFAMYSKNVNIVASIICSVLILLLFSFSITVLTGFNYQVIHNFIEEKEIFMPTFKGRIKEYFYQGATVVLTIAIYSFAMLIPLIGIAFLLGMAPNWITEFFAYLVITFITFLVMPFFMAYAHTFNWKSFYDVKNFKIFSYSLPEFIYSYFLSQMFLIVTSLLFVFVFVIGILVTLLITYLISLVAQGQAVIIVGSIIGSVLVIAGVYAAFVINAFVMFYAFSLNAQSYNYGKYFYYKGEAPKRTKLEVILPILILVLMYCISLINTKINNGIQTLMQESSPQVQEYVQNISE